MKILLLILSLLSLLSAGCIATLNADIKGSYDPSATTEETYTVSHK